MPADGEIIIDVDVDSDKLDDKLKSILEKISSKKIKLDVELKKMSNAKKSLAELDHLINKLSIPSPEMRDQFNKLSESISVSTQKIFILRESIRLLSNDFRKFFKEQLQAQAYNKMMSGILPSKQISGFLPNNIQKLLPSYATRMPVEIIPEINEQKTKEIIDKRIRAISSKTISLEAELSNEKKIKSQINSLKDEMNKLGNSDPELVKKFSALNNELEKSKSKSFVLRQELNEIKKSYKDSFKPSKPIILPSTIDQLRNANIGLKKIAGSAIEAKSSINNLSAPVTRLRYSLENIGKGILSTDMFSNFIKRLTSGFNNIKSSTLSASNHIDYFGRRIFNLLRNAFVFNVISSHFRGLSSLLGNLIHRDTIFVKTLMLVKANLVRAFAPIWQIILPFIRLLGEGLLWLSKIFIRFINFLTGSNIKPVETFMEAKKVVGDFYKIASPKKEMFDLEKPQKATKKLKDNSNKISKNNKNLNKGLNKTNKITNKLLASFDKLETLKFDKNKLAKDPFGLEELKKPKSNDQKLNLDVNVPSVEDQISDAINNIQDKPLDFMVNDNIGDQITSEVNGLTLPTLNFKVDENAQSWVDNLRTKLMEFYVWISPLIIAIRDFAFALVDSFKRLYEDLDKKGFFKLIVKWITKLKEKLTDFFDMLAKNQDKMDNLRNFIVGIGMAFMAFKIIQKVSRLFSLFTSLVSLLSGNPIGWFLMLVAGITMVALNWDKLKKKIPVVTDLLEKFCKDGKKEIGELGDKINKDIKEALKWVGEKLNDMLLWLDKHPGVLQAISDIFSAAAKLLNVLYEIIKFIFKVHGLVTELAWKSIGEKLSEAFDFHGKLPDVSHKIKGLPPIPKLAQGSVLRGGDPFLSWVNDQPRGQTNVEAPLNTIVSAFKQALSESEFNNQPEININASGDMSEIIRLLNFKLQDERIRVGNAFIENIN